MAFDTPILFLIFNRPDTTKRVFEQIREIKPKFLYIAADGARENKQEEKKLTEQTRQIATNIDWDCEVKTLFREKNLGCGMAISRAITWFFEQEEMGIILEDDILPDLSFFEYCSILLKKYKNNPKIWAINGHNFGYSKKNYSYTFSKFMNVWGWATWRRSMVQVDYNMQKWKAIKNKKSYVIKVLNENTFWYQDIWIQNWIKYFNLVAEKKLDTWDFQWIFTQLDNNYLSIIPGKNLTLNIGFDARATHTTNEDHSAAKTKLSTLPMPLKHPVFIKNNLLYEKKYVKEVCYLIPHKNSCKIHVKSYFKKNISGILIKLSPELRFLKSNNEGLKNILNYRSNNTISSKVKIDEPSRIYNSEINNYTYISVNSRISETTIGKFCSIGPNILCGWGIHPTTGISTSPMFYSNLNQAGYSFAKEPKIQERTRITIGNDVFIGMNVTILDGVTIGNGAIIAAGSVVSSNVPDYAIAGGVPAKVIKYRFENEIITKLLDLEWWNWPENRLYLIERYFFNIDEFIKKAK